MYPFDPEKLKQIVADRQRMADPNAGVTTGLLPQAPISSNGGTYKDPPMVDFPVNTTPMPISPQPLTPGPGDAHILPVTPPGGQPPGIPIPSQPKMDPPSYGIPRRFLLNQGGQQGSQPVGGPGPSLIEMLMQRSRTPQSQMPGLMKTIGGGRYNPPMGSDGQPMVPNGWGGWITQSEADRMRASGAVS